MQDIFKRAFTGVIYVSILLGAIVWSPIFFAILFLLLTILCQWEFYKLVESDNIKPQKVIGVVIGAIFFLLYFLILYFNKNFTTFYFVYVIFIAVPLLFTLFLIELFRNNNNSFTNIAYTLLGIIYVVFPFALLNFLVMPPQFRSVPYQPVLLLGFFFLHWANDTGAYLIGTTIGKHRLFERISPKKSWEGAIGGAVITLIVGYVISLFFTQLTLLNWEVIALIVAVFGTLGDLVESMLKRGFNVKDSGNILPGHGGLLDRFDGVLFSAPFVIACLPFIL